VVCGNCNNNNNNNNNDDNTVVVVMNFAMSLIINIVFFCPIIYRGPRFLLCNGSICQKNGRFPGICVAVP